MNVTSNYCPWVRPDRPRPEIPAADLPVEERFAYYRSLVEANQGVLEEGVPTLLGLRGLAPDGQRHDSAENVGPYNDTFVLLERDAAGLPRVNEYLGSTHAGQKSSTSSPGGVAQLRPGNYRTIDHPNHNDMPSWHFVTLQGDDHVPAWRDIDKNGYISDKEKATAEAAGTTATAILLHNGVNADHGRSIGCQTMPPKLFQEFIDRIGEHKNFKYTLIDANLPTPA